MICIFCKNDSSQSTSVEHIIPESLGNKTHILERGVVCDNCNNYFAHKLEKIVLEMPYFRDVRFRNFIENKKRRIPISKGIIGGDVDLLRTKDYRTEVIVENSIIFDAILNGKIKQMIIPMNDLPESNNKYISRFIAKVALESIAQRVGTRLGYKEITEDNNLDLIRNYARFAIGPTMWEYSNRRIYEETDRFYDSKTSANLYEIVHESDFVELEQELFFVVIIFGVEYSINVLNPEIKTYTLWLQNNQNRCPIIKENERKVLKGTKRPF